MDQVGIQQRHKEIANEVLSLLPANCIPSLRNFYVRYDSPEHRGLAGKSTVIISGTVPDDEFRALIVHEAMGHFFELGCLLGTPASGTSAFRDGADIIYNDDPSAEFYAISWLTERVRKSDTRESDFVSGYASWDAFEDLAESVTYYILQESAFRARAQTNATIALKLQWMERYISKPPSIATGTHTWDGKSVPWDATKLPYIWNN